MVSPWGYLVRNIDLRERRSMGLDFFARFQAPMDRSCPMFFSFFQDTGSEHPPIIVRFHIAAAYRCLSLPFFLRMAKTGISLPLILSRHLSLRFTYGASSFFWLNRIRDDCTYSARMALQLLVVSWASLPFLTSAHGSRRGCLAILGGREIRFQPRGKVPLRILVLLQEIRGLVRQWQLLDLTVQIDPLKSWREMESELGLTDNEAEYPAKA